VVSIFYFHVFFCCAWRLIENPKIVAPRQEVMTIYGKGVIVSVANGKSRVKLPFGIAYLGAAAILYAIQTKDSMFVRRDGIMTKFDHNSVNSSDSVTVIGSAPKSVFANECTYLFLRFYVILCAILSDLLEISKSTGPAKDPANSYYNPNHRRMKMPTHRFDYSGVIACIEQVLRGQMSMKDLETFGRKVFPLKVFRIVSIPRLICRCVDALKEVAKDDILLELFDLCQQPNVDLEWIRNRCLSIAPDAYYRIHFSQAKLKFAYIPKNQNLIHSPLIAFEDDDGGTEDDDNDRRRRKRRSGDRSAGDRSSEEDGSIGSDMMDHDDDDDEKNIVDEINKSHSNINDNIRLDVDDPCLSNKRIKVGK
jgi:hypothetical protein